MRIGQILAIQRRINDDVVQRHLSGQAERVGLKRPSQTPLPENPNYPYIVDDGRVP